MFAFERVRAHETIEVYMYLKYVRFWDENKQRTHADTKISGREHMMMWRLPCAADPFVYSKQASTLTFAYFTQISSDCKYISICVSYMWYIFSARAIKTNLLLCRIEYFGQPIMFRMTFGFVLLGRHYLPGIYIGEILRMHTYMYFEC